MFYILSLENLIRCGRMDDFEVQRHNSILWPYISNECLQTRKGAAIRTNR